jgi:hypothetical protein
MVFDQMLQAVQAAAPDRLNDVVSAIWKAYGAGGLTDEQVEQLDALLNARRGAARAAPAKVSTLAEATAKLATACAPASERQGAAAPALSRAHHRTGSRPRTPQSLARRRRMAAAGYLPPALAAAFTSGEQAVLAVIALEVGKRGSCTLALGHIAALAGGCLTVAKRAIRQARTLGLVDVEERRLSRSRNDTNKVTIASREWAAWLRLRLPRASHVGFQEGGGTTVRATTIGYSRELSSSRTQAENRRPAAQNRTTRPAARSAGA